MYTPIEFENLTFKSAALGYSKNEVDDFVDTIAEDYSKIYKENVDLKDKNNLLSDAIKEYKSMETALRDTVVSAHSISDDIKKNAYKEAENIIIEAKNKADEMKNEAIKILTEAEARVNELKQEYGLYRAKMKSFINAQLDILNEKETENENK